MHPTSCQKLLQPLGIGKKTCQDQLGGYKLKQQQDAASLARLEAVRLELAALKSQLEAAVGVQEGVPPQ